MFYFNHLNEKIFLQSDLIKTEHFFTTRDSVIKSKNPELEDIIAGNKRDICRYLNIEENNLISPQQTHTSHIEHARSGKSFYPDTDALLVTSSDIAVFLNFADCTPLIFYDEKKNAGAVAHAGWRGTAGGIAAKTVRAMVKELGCSVKNISAAIGPAVSFCCYNVGEEVLSKLKTSVKNFDGLYEIRQGDIFVDLKRINERQLLEAGVEKIDVCPYCTCCNNNLFFSYRKENATTSRHSAILKIK